MTTSAPRSRERVDPRNEVGAVRFEVAPRGVSVLPPCAVSGPDDGCDMTYISEEGNWSGQIGRVNPAMGMRSQSSTYELDNDPELASIVMIAVTASVDPRTLLVQRRAGRDR